MNFTSKEDALSLIKDSFTPDRVTEVVKTTEAVGRVLASDVYSLVSIPVVRASAMDGVAVKSADFASSVPDTESFVPGTDYVRADTGDDFPDAFDSVIPVEAVTFNARGGFTLNLPEPFRNGMNVRATGSMVRKGELIMKKGRKLSAFDISRILSGGVWSVSVVKKPVVAFIPTGSELVPVGSELKRGQNYDTNSFLVSSLLSEWGAESVLYPVVKDSRSEIEDVLSDAVNKADIVLLSAGTSKGEEDYTHRILASRGRLLFHEVKAAPGRPMAAAAVDGKLVINLSGPSVAAFHGMLWCVRPVLEYWLGGDEVPLHTVEAELTDDLVIKFPISILLQFHIFSDGGKWYAVPLPFKAPRPEGLIGEATNAVYMCRPGEKNHSRGEKLTLEVI